jgi:hypothetical protein
LLGTSRASLNVTVISPAWDIVVMIAVRVVDVPLVMMFETMIGISLVLLLLPLLYSVRLLKLEELDDDELAEDEIERARTNMFKVYF